jgi:hypothetical protein
MEDPPAVELSQDRARARTSSRREPRGIRENILSMLQINGIRQTRIRAKSSGNLAGQKQNFYEGISALCPLKLPVPDFAISPAACYQIIVILVPHRVLMSLEHFMYVCVCE